MCARLPKQLSVRSASLILLWKDSTSRMRAPAGKTLTRPLQRFDRPYSAGIDRRLSGYVAPFSVEVRITLGRSRYDFAPQQ